MVIKTEILGAIAFVTLSTAPVLAQGAPVIGPGTPCTFAVTEPTKNADGTPLTVPLLDYRFYLDPPPTGPVIGVSVPAFTVPRSAMTITTNVPPAPAGTTATASICKNMPTPITTGDHTTSITVRAAGGESAGVVPVPFVFQGIPPASPSNPTFK